MIRKKLFLIFLFFCKSVFVLNSMSLVFDDELRRTSNPDKHLEKNKILKFPLSLMALEILKSSTVQFLKEIKNIRYAIKNVNQKIQELEKIKLQNPNAHEVIGPLTELNENHAKDLYQKIKTFIQEILYKLQTSNITFENYKKFYRILRIISTYEEELSVYSFLYDQLNLLKEPLLEFLKNSLKNPQIDEKIQDQLKQTLELTQKLDFFINYDELIKKLANFQ